MTITLCNGKGGSGKTTLTILLGAAMAEAGHRVAVLDTDPQKTATRWIEEIGGLTLFQEDQSYTALLIDTPPRLDCKEFTDAVCRADVTRQTAGESRQLEGRSTEVEGRDIDILKINMGRANFRVRPLRGSLARISHEPSSKKPPTLA